jgi:hypothetical protein
MAGLVHEAFMAGLVHDKGNVIFWQLVVYLDEICRVLILRFVQGR